MVQHNDVNSGPSLRTKTTESDEKRTNQKKVADIEKEIRKKNKRRDEIRERSNNQNRQTWPSIFNLLKYLPRNTRMAFLSSTINSQ